jgi:hypothetical protein
MRGLFPAVLACAVALAACGGVTERGRAEASGGTSGAASEGGRPGGDKTPPPEPTVPLPLPPIDLDPPGAAGAPPVDDPKTCDCLEVEIAWWIEGGVGSRQAEAHLSPCNSFYFGRQGEGTCSTTLDDCSQAFNLEEVIAALKDPEVRAALAQAPVLFGRDLRDVGGQLDHIEIDGKVIEIGDECDGSAPCSMPRGVVALDHLLGRLMARQRGACTNP